MPLKHHKITSIHIATLCVLGFSIGTLAESRLEIAHRLTPEVKRTQGDESRLILSGNAKSLGRIKPFWRTTPIPDRWQELNENWIKKLPETYRNAPLYKGRVAPDPLLPFCDTISAVRLLGGWDKTWKDYPGGVDERLDLAYRKDDGKLAYRWELLHARMDDFIGNNVNMLIVLDNVPYCFVKNSANELYGQVMGPDDPKEYGVFIRDLCKEIVRKYGRKTAEKLRFRIGTEPDLIDHWKDSTEKYCQMYDYATAAIREVLPKAHVGPGNFLSKMNGRQMDAMDVMKHLATGKNYATGKIGSPVDFLAISHYYSPSGPVFAERKTEADKRMLLDVDSHEDIRVSAYKLKSYRALSPRFKDVSLEIHEFGVLSSELYKESRIFKANAGVREAAWVHQAYITALDEGFSDIFFWRGIDYSCGKDKPVLHGSGWLRSMLDLGEGGEWYILDRVLATKNESSAMALVSVKKDAAYIFSSVYNLYRKNDADEVFSIELDRSLLPFAGSKPLAVREYYQNKGNNIIEQIYQNLKKEGMIKKEFDNGEIYKPSVLSTPSGKCRIAFQSDKFVKMFTDSFDAQPFKGKIEDKSGKVIITRKVTTPSLLVLEVTAE